MLHTPVGTVLQWMNHVTRICAAGKEGAEEKKEKEENTVSRILLAHWRMSLVA